MILVFRHYWKITHDYQTLSENQNLGAQTPQSQSGVQQGSSVLMVCYIFSCNKYIIAYRGLSSFALCCGPS